MSMNSASDGAVQDSSGQNVYDDSWSKQMASQCNKYGRGLGSVITADAAERYGAVVTWNGPRMATAEFDGKRALVVGPSCTESALSAALVSDKLLTKRILSEAGVTTPAGRIVVSAEDAVMAQRELGRAVVVKPRYGAMGRGVTVNIGGRDELRRAYDRANVSGSEVLVEEYIQGAEYRGHGSPKECVAVFQRLLPNVIGDGSHTIIDLVAIKNETRKLNPNTMTNLIKLDDIAKEYLLRQGLSEESIPAVDETVVVRDVNGITSGGDSRECLEDVPDSVRAVTSAAIAAIPGMEWGGTDLIVRDGTAEAFVMEVNTFASISGSVFPVFGTPRDTADEVWRRIRDRTAPEASKSNVIPAILDQPVSVCSLVARRAPTGLTRIFQHMVSTRGYVTTSQGRSSYTASLQDEVLWFAGCLSKADFTRPHRMMNKQNTLRRMLRAGGVPQVQGRLISELAQLKSFVRARDETTLMIPPAGQFSDHDVRLLPEQAQVSAASIAGSSSWLVQEYPAGRRYTVIASRAGALTVIARRTAQLTNVREIQGVAELAVDAVRAVPELRWGAVQLVVPQIGTEALVEGMTNRPVFSPGDYLVAGSFDEVTDLVLDGARHGV